MGLGACGVPGQHAQKASFPRICKAWYFGTVALRAAPIEGYDCQTYTERSNVALVRNGTCLKCETCGSTMGCS
jgi:hypothetical protein